jgi:exodeoxyribonuclease V alpha subunit
MKSPRGRKPAESGAALTELPLFAYAAKEGAPPVEPSSAAEPALPREGGGAARAPLPVVGSLAAAGYLSPLDAAFAATIARLGGEKRPEVLLAAACTSRQVGAGHVCLDLGRLVAQTTLPTATGETVPAPPWPELASWRKALRESPVVSDGTGTPRPLVLDGGDRVYLHRYWAHQEALAEALRGRIGADRPAVDEALLAEGLERLFPAHLAAEPGAERPRLAAERAVRRSFCVVSGGPGTGKTTTVVKILALLVEQAASRGRRFRAELLAPTGKAATRLAEAIRAAKAGLACEPTVKDAIPDETRTIHRALGAQGSTGTRFRHGPEKPLAADLVLVDEASMVDLALMARLLSALPAEARVVLLGDRHQLASVEAGSVLGDICELDPSPVVFLTRSHRYDPRSGIALLADAIQRGDADGALEILASAEHPDVERVDPALDGPGEALVDGAVAGYRPYLDAAEAEARLDALGRFRVLCAHRRGPHGVERVNQLVEDALVQARLIDRQGPTYAGRPLLVTRNDYALQLFNGDVGVIVAETDDPTRRRAVFRTAEGPLRRLSAARLPPHETVFAMSIHKSQGSEFDEIAILLGEPESPLLSRELLYTAITRARRRVRLHATPAAIAAAIRRPIERSSGLRSALGG